MSVHRNAKLGLAGRFALVSAVEGGASLRSAAAAFNVSPATAHRWWHRWFAAGEEARSTLSCLFDRSSRPHCSPRQRAAELEKVTRFAWSVAYSMRECQASTAGAVLQLAHRNGDSPA